MLPFSDLLTVLGPLLFSLHINDIMSDIESEIRLFADDCVCYREIKDIEDTLKLQKDIDRLGIWARKWGMRFQPVKCNMMQLTNKHNKIQASYTLEGNVLENVDSIKYLGVTITSDLKWNSHIRNVCSKANRTLGFLRRNLFSCPQDVKEAAYKSLVRPILEYGSTVWDPHYNGLNDELENVQKRAARFVTRNYSYETGSMTGILEELKWETLQKRRKDNRLILLYKGLKGKARIPTDDLIPKNRRCRNQHSLVFQIPSASIDAYKKSFFPQTIRDWNVLPDSLISFAELSDDCVSKFTSQPVKCNMMQLTNKTLNKIQASYTLEGTVLENVDNIKYLGVTITNDLKWNTHISNICTKANRTLGFLRRTLFSCPQNVKEAAYKGMVRPILEYGSSVWDPHPDKLKKELEKVQNRAARFVTRNYDYETGSMTGILGQLKWESLKKRRKDNRLILLYKGLKGKAKIPTDDLIPKTRHGRNQHSLAFQIPSASKDVYMYSFFPQTIRDWNDLPESLISSSELSDDSRPGVIVICNRNQL